MIQNAWLCHSKAAAAALREAVLFPWLLSHSFQANSYSPRKGCGFCMGSTTTSPSPAPAQWLSCAHAVNAAVLPILHHRILALKITPGCRSATCPWLCGPGCRQQQAAVGCASLWIKLYTLKQGADKPIFCSRTLVICLISAKWLPVLKIHPTLAPDPGLSLYNMLVASIHAQQHSTFFWWVLQELREQLLISTNFPKVGQVASPRKVKLHQQMKQLCEGCKGKKAQLQGTGRAGKGGWDLRTCWSCCSATRKETQQWLLFLNILY